jgi:hypothetical protein
MAQSFDIRFARTAGLAALLEVPENAFRWRGGGLLRIDAHGISIGLKRSLLALLGGKRTQRIPTENLRAVYREGDALRVEFQSGDSARVVLPFWADDRDTAARIVGLLPTSQTVEIEHSTDVTHSGNPRADWRMLLTLGLLLMAFIVGSWALYDRAQLPPASAQSPVSVPVAVEAPFGSVPMPDATTSLVESPTSPAEGAVPTGALASPASADAASTNPDAAIPDFLEPPPVELRAPGPLPLPRDYIRSEDFVIPIARDTAPYYVGKTQLAAFEQEANQLYARWDAMHDQFVAGAMTAEEFAGKLDDLEMRWWDVTFRMFDNDALADPALNDLRATMLSIARFWRSFLVNYATGLRERDHVKMGHSYDDLTRAQERRMRARLFVR